MYSIEMDKILGQNASLEVTKFNIERRFSLERVQCGIRKLEIIEDTETPVKEFIHIDNNTSSLMVNVVNEINLPKAEIFPFWMRAFATGESFADFRFELTI